jgi:hypothetical protein
VWEPSPFLFFMIFSCNCQFFSSLFIFFQLV